MDMSVVSMERVDFPRPIFTVTSKTFLDIIFTNPSRSNSTGSPLTKRGMSSNDTHSFFSSTSAPEYPAALLARNVEGDARVSFIVDTTGLADLTSFEVLEATQPEFGMAVRRALPDMRFRPAILAGRKVRQLVQQTFMFRIQRPVDSVPPDTGRTRPLVSSATNGAPSWPALT